MKKKIIKPSILANGKLDMAKCRGTPCGRPCKKVAG